MRTRLRRDTVASPSKFDIEAATNALPQAYELSVLTGTQVLLLVVSETGLVYTFTTPKLQPLVTKPEGKNLIQVWTHQCLYCHMNQLTYIRTGLPQRSRTRRRQWRRWRVRSRLARGSSCRTTNARQRSASHGPQLQPAAVHDRRSAAGSAISGLLAAAASCPTGRVPHAASARYATAALGAALHTGSPNATADAMTEDMKPH